VSLTVLFSSRTTRVSKSSTQLPFNPVTKSTVFYVLICSSPFSFPGYAPINSPPDQLFCISIQISCHSQNTQNSAVEVVFRLFRGMLSPKRTQKILFGLLFRFCPFESIRETPSISRVCLWISRRYVCPVRISSVTATSEKLRSSNRYPCERERKRRVGPISNLLLHAFPDAIGLPGASVTTD
jgi:hypothetical protein